MSRRQVLVRGAAWGLASTLLAFACGGSSEPDSNAAGEAGMGPGHGGSGASAGSIGTPVAGQPGSTGGNGNPGGGDNVGGETGCVGLACDVPTCAVGTTSISGQVFAPSGTLPLYNVSVFVPNGPVPELVPGPTCDRCDASGVPGVPNVTHATTDETGSFVLEHAPAGENIPLVVQVGKWRRQVSIPRVLPCVDTALGSEQTRLARNKKEGDIPRIAIAAGAGDQMECLPRRMGLDDSEFTTSAGAGRIHLYGTSGNVEYPAITHFDASLNGGATLPHATELWASLDSLKQYDLLILSCEGNSNAFEKPASARQAMYDYASLGGRSLRIGSTSGFRQAPRSVAGTGAWTDRQDPSDLDAPLAATVNQSFAKGAALAKWLYRDFAPSQRSCGRSRPGHPSHLYDSRRSGRSSA